MKKAIIGLISGFIILVALVIGLFRFTEKINNGNVGIRYSMNGGVKDKALGQGVHFVGLDYVTQYPIRTQTVHQEVGLATKDGKKTVVNISYAYHVDATKAVNVYKKFGSADILSIEKGWLSQKLQKAGRDTMSEYTLLDVMGSSSAKVQGGILTAFQQSVEKQGFIIEDLSFGVPSVDAQTQKSIDDLIKAGQDNKRAELEAKSKQIKAEAAAKAKLTRADATAQANEKINNSVTDKTIQYMEAQARLKHGWVTTQGNGSVITDQTK
ncbi:SPFH domain-containing protein [Liquorilactobacillus hordei]|uniref:SPFH domain-containing protein n=1 Tax=Liquorilactobacillus hordei TaxID=468911 RepID=UPI0039EC0866